MRPESPQWDQLQYLSYCTFYQLLGPPSCIQYLMSERKVWTEEEDQALKKILSKGQKKWNTVAELMERDFKIYGRSGKQCRQRWHNQLDPNINNDSWSRKEENELFRLHNEMGNSWAKISQHFNRRTDNSVKNHFYSTLRKAFRRLNRYLVEAKCHKNKQLKTIVLTKLLAAAEDKFDRKLKLAEQVIEKSIELKNRLIQLAYDIDEGKQEPKKLDELIEELHTFTKSWKRKKKKGKKCQQQFEEEDGQEEVCSEEKPKTTEQEPHKSSKNTKKIQVPEPKIRQIQKPNPKLFKKPSNPPIIPPIQPLAQRRQSRKQSMLQAGGGQPQRMHKLLSNFSYGGDEDELMMLQKKSSNRSNYSIFGRSLFPRISEIEVSRAPGISLNESNNLGTKNLFQSSDFLGEN